jgi:hypothetical protein
MAMVCPKCNGSFEQRLQCPQCEVRLLYQASRTAVRAGSAESAHAWQQTPWGRLVVGLLLSQGLYQVFRQLCTAGSLLARNSGTEDVWNILTSLILLQALQALGVSAAGLIVGAGHRRGFLLGAMVGVWNAVLFLGLQFLFEQPLTMISLVGDPTFQVVAGALGGLAGSLIWRPATELVPVSREPSSRPMVSLPRRSPAWAGPVAWGRVLAGIALAVGGVVWADVIREFVLDASEGRLKIESHLQAQLVTWEISGLAILAGAALAGATTRNGLKQGLCTGLGISTMLLGIHLGVAPCTWTAALLTLGSTLALSLVGGWFGSELLPPVLPARRRRPLASL